VAERLTEMYAVGTAVQIWPDEQEWLSGVVVAHQPPAVWVRTEDGRSWFVTNRRRIRANRIDAKGAED
jgi:hypothetical protein